MLISGSFLIKNPFSKPKCDLSIHKYYFSILRHYFSMHKYNFSIHKYNFSIHKSLLGLPEIFLSHIKLNNNELE